MIIFISSIFLYFTVLILKTRFLIQQLPERGSFFKFNPISIYFWLSFPIEIFKIAVGPIILTTVNEDYFYIGIAILYATLSILIEFLILFILSKKIKKINFKFNLKEIKTIKINFKPLSFIFFIFYIISFYLLATKEFGLYNWILNPRLGYQLYRDGSGQYWILSVSFLALSFSLLMLNKYSIVSRSLYFLFYSYFAFLLGSKGMVIEYLIFFILILWLYKDKSLKKILIFISPIVVIAILYNFYTSVENFDFDSVASYFTYYTNSGMYFKEYYTNKIGLFHGKLLLSDFWSLAPRSLFPNKPYVYGILEINEYFFPGAAEMTNTPAFGGPILYFADFGILGVIFLTIFNPILFLRSIFYLATIFNLEIDKIKNNFSIYFLFLVFFSPYFLALVVFPLNFIFIILVLLFFLVYIKIYLKLN
jgi:hypothetical protein